jgi:acetyl esterase/lipase
LKKQTNNRKPFYRRKAFLWTAGSIVGLILVILIAFRVSAWPGAMVIRFVFTRNDTKASKALEKHQPAIPITAINNQQYRSHDNAAFLDVYMPASVARTTTKLPVVIWTHGGAWVSGDKTDNLTYFKLLAAQGYTVISANYSRGPEKRYPTAVHQLNDMYAYVQAQADRFHVDTDKIFLAGDSAGAQLSSQMAVLITNPAYAAEMQIKPNLRPSQLRGMILNCGIYKMDDLIHPDPTLPKIVGWGDDISVWAYTGRKDVTNPALKQMSAQYHVTSNFPATYITGGNGDPLTSVQAKPFATKLEKLGVPLTKLFYADNHQPSLPHEYQFNLDNADGQAAFTATSNFLKEHTN